MALSSESAAGIPKHETGALHEAEFASVLTRRARVTAYWQLGLGIVFLPLSVLIAFLPSFDRSPRAENLDIVIYGMAALAAAMAVFLVHLGLKTQQRVQLLLEILRSSPSRVSRAFGRIIRVNGIENYLVHVHLNDRKLPHVVVTQAEFEPVLEYIWRCAPSAAKTPP